jgi:hypothetical protein
MIQPPPSYVVLLQVETLLNGSFICLYGFNIPVGCLSKSIYYIEQNANVVGVGTDIKFKIFSGKLLDVAPKSRLADRA